MNRMSRFRSLQQKLGFYAFVLSFGAMAAVSVLSYRVARDQVQEDRQQLMEVYARQIAQDLDRELSNAAKELRLWGEADFVQASLKNSQNRLFATFFDELVRHQPKYDLIFTIGPDGRIADINSLGRGESGKPIETLLPGLSPSWLRQSLESGKPQGIGWRQLAFVNGLYGRSTANAKIEQRYHIALAAPVGEHGGGHTNGLIIGVLNWSYFQQILDRAAEGFRRLDLTSGYAFLNASDCDTTIGHKYRDLYGLGLIRDHHLLELHERLQSKPSGTFRYKWREGWKIVALAKINPGDLGPDFEWRLGVGINESDIFAPIQHLFAWFIIISGPARNFSGQWIGRI